MLYNLNKGTLEYCEWNKFIFQRRGKVVVTKKLLPKILKSIIEFCTTFVTDDNVYICAEKLADLRKVTIYSTTAPSNVVNLYLDSKDISQLESI